MLDFRVDTFLTVCKYMNFTKASEELNITQPAVSHHIRHLEEDYQVKLFVYQGKKLSLTSAGAAFLNAATTMKHDEIHLRDRLGQIVKKGGRLVFGATLTVGEYMMPEAIMRYLRQYPDSSVRMVVADTKELLVKLDGGEIDFAVVEGFFQKSEYDFLVFGRETFAAVCAPGYVFKQKVTRIEDLLRERLIIREQGSGTRKVFERYLEARNLIIEDFLNIVEINNIDAVKTMAAAGYGITFLYERAVGKELARGSLERIRLEDFNLNHDFTFIWRKNSIFSGYYHMLFELLHGDV